MRRPLVIFLTLLLLSVIVGQLNHALSGWHVSIFLGGLCVAFAALRLKRKEGLLAVIAGGLLFDANAPFIGLLHFDPASLAIPNYSNQPIWFGCHALLFAMAHSFVFHFRNRVPREESLVGILAALLSNLAIFLGISFVAVSHAPAGADVWPRLFVDLMLSQTVLAIVAPWFLALQSRSLEIAGIDLRAEARGLR